MMRKLRLQQEREAEEKVLCAAAPAAAPLLAQLASVYDRLRATSEIPAALDQVPTLTRTPTLTLTLTR